MANFKYKARKASGELVDGALSANSQAEAINKLVELNLFPIEVEEDKVLSVKQAKAITPAINKEKIKATFKKLSKNKISSKELLVFTQKLATLNRARMELLPSLKILYDQIDNLYFREILLKVYNYIKEGETFSVALSRFPKIFSSLYVSLIKAGEASGNMAEALTQLTDFIHTKQNLKNKVLGALIYPAILLCVGFVSIFVILNFVIPKLKGIFAEMGASIPLATKIILEVSEFSSKNWTWVILVISVFLFILVKKGKDIFSGFSKWLLMRLPVISRLLKNQELASFARALSLLIRSGVSPLQSLEISSLSIEASGMRVELGKVAEKIKDGQSISKSMQGFKSLPDFFIKMIAIGEESSRLEEVLEEVASSYIQQIEADVDVISSVLEPVLILALGVVLGGIVLSILLPIFQVTQMVH